MGSSLALKSVMVVEDDEGVLMLLGEVLENSGYLVRPFFNPIHALEDARREVPDAIILDWYLPYMNGQDFIVHLNARIQRPPPVLVLTGDVKLRRVNGIAEVLIKPVGLDLLIQRVGIHTGRTEAPRTVANG